MVLIKVKKDNKVIKNICCQNAFVNFETNLVSFYDGCHNWQKICNVKEIKSELLDLSSSLIMHTVKIVDAIESLKEPKQELPEYVETNLNDYVKVKLNEHGREIHRKFWEPYCCKNLPYKYPEVDSEGYSKFQIHDFIFTFGSECSLGSLPFCEGNNILIQRSR